MMAVLLTRESRNAKLLRLRERCRSCCGVCDQLVKAVAVNGVECLPSDVLCRPETRRLGTC